jgi:cullin-4
VDDVWQDHCDNMLTIRSVFLYLDRSFVMQAPNLLPIWELGLKLFRDNLAGKGHLEHKTVRGLLGLIERERNGEAVRGRL